MIPGDGTGTAGRRPYALILSGGGRYADPWHPFEETSAELAGLLREEGFETEVTSSIAERLEELSGVDLLVANAAEPSPALDTGVADAARTGLLDYLGRGGPVLAVHVSVTTLLGIPEWSDAIGARWVRGVSMHPPRGRARVGVPAGTDHEIVRGIDGFELDDERYVKLSTVPGLQVLVAHDHDGQTHPLLWVHHYGGAPVVADCLGHNLDSYRSAEHRRLIRRSARWLTSPHANTISKE